MMSLLENYLGRFPSGIAEACAPQRAVMQQIALTRGRGNIDAAGANLLRVDDGFNNS